MAFTYVYNKVVATLIRTMAARTYSTHQDDVLYVPSRDPDRTIKVHVYRNSGSVRPKPVLINFHGSGFMIPMHGSDDEFALRIKKDTAFTVLDVQYRLAPEYPYPAAPNDAEDVVKWVLSQPEEYDRERISVSGFSAGATLALGLSGHAFPPDIFRHVLAFYPPTDLSKDPYAKVAPDQTGKPIPAWLAAIFDGFYAPAPVDRKQPLLSPSFIEADRFPDNMLFITCAWDTLAPEAEELAERISAVPGKHVVHKRMEKCNHAWDKEYKSGTIQEQAKDHAYDMAVEMLHR